MLIKAKFPVKREIHQQARNQHTDPQEPQSQVSLVRLSQSLKVAGFLMTL